MIPAPQPTAAMTDMSMESPQLLTDQMPPDVLLTSDDPKGKSPKAGGDSPNSQHGTTISTNITATSKPSSVDMREADDATAEAESTESAVVVSSESSNAGGDSSQVEGMASEEAGQVRDQPECLNTSATGDDGVTKEEHGDGSLLKVCNRYE